MLARGSLSLGETADVESPVAIKYNSDGLVPAIAQDAVTGEVLMLAWMNEATLRETLDTGRMVYWSRSRQERWAKGDTSGDVQRVVSGAYDCDSDALLFRVEQAGGACHTEHVLLLPQSAHRYDSLNPVGRHSAEGVSPSRDDFRALAGGCTVVPVWREVVADLGTPVAAFLRLVGPGDGFILESVDRERWGRWSFVGRNSPGRVVSAGGRVTATGVCSGVDQSGGMLRAAELLLARFRGPDLAELPPLHSGLVGWLGYDVVREIEHLADSPLDDRTLPDGSLSVIGDLAAFDHWRQRVTLIHNVMIEPDASVESLDRSYDLALVRPRSIKPGRSRATRPADPVAPAPRSRSAPFDSVG